MVHALSPRRGFCVVVADEAAWTHRDSEPCPSYIREAFGVSLYVLKPNVSLRDRGARVFQLRFKSKVCVSIYALPVYEGTGDRDCCGREQCTVSEDVSRQRERNVTYQDLRLTILPSLIDVLSGSRPRGCSLRKVRQSDPLLRKALRCLETWKESRIPAPSVVLRRGEAFLTSLIDSRVVNLHCRVEALWAGMSVAMSSASVVGQRR